MPRKDPVIQSYAPDEPPFETDMDRVASEAHNDALEEAAQLAMRFRSHSVWAGDIAAAIRALKDQD